MASQQRWRKALAGLCVLWVGVRCDGAVAAGRELARADRIIGMAASQAPPAEAVARTVRVRLRDGDGIDIGIDITALARIRSTVRGPPRRDTVVVAATGGAKRWV
jgi:chloramphenicol 3-O phosphotransferase